MHFNYTGVALPEPGRIVNDIKEVNGHFLMGMHANGPTVYSTASKGNADTFPPSTPLFSHFSGDDKYIVSLGFVVDGDGGATRNATRVLGALYGAGAIPALDNNRVFAAWLQRHVLFEVRRGRGGGRFDAFPCVVVMCVCGHEYVGTSTSTSTSTSISGLLCEVDRRRLTALHLYWYLVICRYAHHVRVCACV